MRRLRWFHGSTLPTLLPGSGMYEAALISDPSVEGPTDFQIYVRNPDNSAWLLIHDTAVAGGLPAGGATGTVLTKQSAADGDADWQVLPPSLYEAAYWAFETASNAVNPEPTSDTLIDGMTCAFTIPTGGRDVEVQINLLALKSGGSSRIVLYDGTNEVLGVTTGANSLRMTDNGDNDVKRLSHTVVLTLSAGSYSFNLKHQASGNTNTITWYERSLVVKVIAP